MNLFQKLLSILFKKEKASPGPVEPEWITKEQFRMAARLTHAAAEKWYEPVKAACIEYGVKTPSRIAAFLAQVGHESGGFVHSREIWGPTPAQKRYEGRKDLGNVQPGDGSKFRGRGLIQLTGRHNYQALADAFGVDVIKNPGLVEQPELAARSAAWFWHSKGCNSIADSGDFEVLTRRINGGLNGFDDRVDRWEHAKGILGVHV